VEGDRVAGDDIDVVDRAKCDECGTCVAACPNDAIVLD
jgi:ferredoxin